MTKEQYIVNFGKIKWKKPFTRTEKDFLYFMYDNSDEITKIGDLDKLFSKFRAHMKDQHPVMQEGKEDISIRVGDIDNPTLIITPTDSTAQLISRPTTDLDHEGNGQSNRINLGMPLYETPYSRVNNIPDYTKGCSDVPSGEGIREITGKFIEQARDAEMKLISELFKTATGEELTEENAHRVGLSFGYDRCLSIDGKMLGKFEQQMLPTDNGYKCSITFVPYE